MLRESTATRENHIVKYSGKSSSGESDKRTDYTGTSQKRASLIYRRSGEMEKQRHQVQLLQVPELLLQAIDGLITWLNGSPPR